MQLKYGTYTFDANEVRPVSRREGIVGEDMVIHTVRTIMEVTGRLIGDGQADLIAKESALITALAKQNQDLLFLADNNAQTGISMLTANSFTGVRILKGPDFSADLGAEYATIRSYSFLAEMETNVAGNSKKLISFREKVAYSGGGKRYIGRDSVVGPSQIQLVNPNRVYVAVQSGEAVGLTEYPDPPAALFPNAARDEPVYELIGPDKVGVGNYRNFTLTWSYTFYSLTPLFATGFPTKWPATL